jgi:phage shock protein E
MNRQSQRVKISFLVAAILSSALLASVTACASVSEIQSVPSDSLVIDVRTPREYARWHYPGARNIPVTQLEKNLKALGDKSQEIIVYCRSGNRSSTAKRILLAAGFTNVLNGGGLRDMKPLAGAVR